LNAPADPARFSLDDKYTVERGRVFLTGTQALIRLLMLQRTRDELAGLNTAGFVSGYRGSPLGGLDQALWRAQKHLDSHHIKFQPGVNEDLAAAAIWGTQQVTMFPKARYDGVFGMWYGKGPGVDRCGDVFKHANAAGTAKHGGVLVLAGRRPRGEVLDAAAPVGAHLQGLPDPALEPGERPGLSRPRPARLRDEPLFRLLDRFQMRHRRGRVRRLGGG
jgi:hypothetical protein